MRTIATIIILLLAIGLETLVLSLIHI